MVHGLALVMSPLLAAAPLKQLVPFLSFPIRSTFFLMGLTAAFWLGLVPSLVDSWSSDLGLTGDSWSSDLDWPTSFLFLPDSCPCGLACFFGEQLPSGLGLPLCTTAAHLSLACAGDVNCVFLKVTNAHLGQKFGASYDSLVVKHTEGCGPCGSARQFF